MEVLKVYLPKPVVNLILLYTEYLNMKNLSKDVKQYLDKYNCKITKLKYKLKGVLDELDDKDILVYTLRSNINFWQGYENKSDLMYDLKIAEEDLNDIEDIANDLHYELSDLTECYDKKLNYLQDLQYKYRKKKNKYYEILNN